MNPVGISDVVMVLMLLLTLDYDNTENAFLVESTKSKSV